MAAVSVKRFIWCVFFGPPSKAAKDVTNLHIIGSENKADADL